MGIGLDAAELGCGKGEHKCCTSSSKSYRHLEFWMPCLKFRQGRGCIRGEACDTMGTF